MRIIRTSALAAFVALATLSSGSAGTTNSLFLNSGDFCKATPLPQEIRPLTIDDWSNDKTITFARLPAQGADLRPLLPSPRNCAILLALIASGACVAGLVNRMRQA